MVTIIFVRCTVCTVGLTVSAIEQQVEQTECLSLEYLCGVPSVLWGLLLVEQGNWNGRLTVDPYSNCAVYRLYFGAYC